MTMHSNCISMEKPRPKPGQGPRITEIKRRDAEIYQFVLANAEDGIAPGMRQVMASVSELGRNPQEKVRQSYLRLCEQGLLRKSFPTHGKGAVYRLTSIRPDPDHADINSHQ